MKDAICQFSFSNFTFGFHASHPEKVDNASVLFLSWLAEENLEVKSKDNAIGLIVAPFKFDVLKASIFALEVSTVRQISKNNYQSIVSLDKTFNLNISAR